MGDGDVSGFRIRHSTDRQIVRCQLTAEAAQRQTRRMRTTGFVFAILLLATAALAQEPIATFSILGYDPATGEVGGAVQSRVFSVGNGVLWAEAGVGAVATQAIVDVS